MFSIVTLCCRIIFPELPADGSSMQIYPESSCKASTPVSEEMGFLQRQISEVDEEEERLVIATRVIIRKVRYSQLFISWFILTSLKVM